MCACICCALRCQRCPSGFFDSWANASTPCHGLTSAGMHFNDLSRRINEHILRYVLAQVTWFMSVLACRPLICSNIESTMPCTTHTLAVRASSALARQQRRNTCICRAELDKFRSESNFEDQSLSSRVSKGIVSGLTAAVNLVIPAQTDVIKRSSDIELKPEDVRTGGQRGFSMAPCSSVSTQHKLVQPPS